MHSTERLGTIFLNLLYHTFTKITIFYMTVFLKAKAYQNWQRPKRLYLRSSYQKY